jgi:hypothetical protein
MLYIVVSTHVAVETFIYIIQYILSFKEIIEYYLVVVKGV